MLNRRQNRSARAERSLPYLLAYHKARLKTEPRYWTISPRFTHSEGFMLGPELSEVLQMKERSNLPSPMSSVQTITFVL